MNSPVERDPEREDRIHNDAIVDAYGPEEQAIGWYYYLADNIQAPFQGKCIGQRGSSPLKIGETVEVLGMASAEDCECDMLVQIRLMDRTFGVPLAQIESVDADEQTERVIGDWHYWVARGYEF